MFTIHQHLSAFVQKCGMEKYQDHLANDGASSHMFGRKNKNGLVEVSFIILVREGNSRKLFQAGYSLFQTFYNSLLKID